MGSGHQGGGSVRGLGASLKSAGCRWQPFNGLSKTLLLVDSITEAVGVGAGRIVISGSHGGVSSARYALQAAPLLAVFNDAGVGKDGAGIAALPLLQAQGIAACTVAHASARIGEARSTLEDGIVSHLNESAALLGLAVGQPLRQAVAALTPA